MAFTCKRTPPESRPASLSTASGTPLLNSSDQDARSSGKLRPVIASRPSAQRRSADATVEVKHQPLLRPQFSSEYTVIGSTSLAWAIAEMKRAGSWWYFVRCRKSYRLPGRINQLETDICDRTLQNCSAEPPRTLPNILNRSVSLIQVDCGQLAS